MTDAGDASRPDRTSRARRSALRLAALVVGPVVLVVLASSLAWGSQEPPDRAAPAMRLGGPSAGPSDGPSDSLPAATPAVTVGPVRAAAGPVRATEPVQLSADVSNVGAVDAVGVRVTFFASMGDAPPIAIGPVILDLAPGESDRAQVAWTPRAPGTWLIRVRLFGSDSEGPAALVRVAAAPNPDAEAVLTAQELPANALIGIAVLLVIAVALAATTGNRLLRP